MKRQITIAVCSFLAIAGIFLMLPGCSTETVITKDAAGNPVTNTTRVLDVALATNTINIIVPLAVTEAIVQDPSAKPYIQDAAVAINTFLGGTNYAPAALDAVLAQIPSKAVQNAQTIAAINAAVGIYESSYAQAVNQNVSLTNLIPILQAIGSGLTKGLANSP